MFFKHLNGQCQVKTVLMMLLGGGLVVGLSLPALAVSLVELHKLTPSDAAADDYFGQSVAISGATALVGAADHDGAGSYFGSAYLFDVATGSQIAKLTASDAAADDQFGFSVAISGDTALVGAYGNDVTGSAYLYDFSDPSNIIETKLNAPDASDAFGYSVGLSGTTALMGDRLDDDAGSNSGAAYLFDFSNPLQIIEIKLTASDAAADDQFGISVAISGATGLVGAYGNDDAGTFSGSAYLYDVTTGRQLAKLTASDAAAGDYFGGSVAISDTTALVGAEGNDDAGNNSGSAYLFDVATGSQIAKLTASDAAAGDLFGISVAISGSTALVGAFGNDDAGDLSGSAYLYDFSDPFNIIETKLTASDADAGDRFARPVAISGTAALVGASGNDDAGNNSGSAYVFALDTDGDGLPDIWEIDGIDSDGDGTIDLDLPALDAELPGLGGADPYHKDLFVEVDAMLGRAPTQATLDRIVAAFAAVPNALVDNPDGQDGITLHIQLDETDVSLAPWPNAFGDFDTVKAARFGTPAQRASANWANIKAAKALAYRYCIFADTYGGTASSGLAERPGNDFMVTLGGWHPPGGTPNQQAGTFMHELGHTLGLLHGGADSIHHKPNYHSVMNYTWQVPRTEYTASWVLDYSRAAWPTLDESHLIEADGIGGHLGHRLPVGPVQMSFVNQLVNEHGPVDWNVDNDVADSNIAVDINRLRSSQAASPGQVLAGFCDWSNLRYALGGHPNFQDGVHTETTIDTEMTFQVFQEIGCRPGDFDCDRDVDLADLSFLISHWLDMLCDGTALDETDWCFGTDLGRNGEVDLPDLAVFAEHWLEGTAP